MRRTGSSLVAAAAVWVSVTMVACGDEPAPLSSSSSAPASSAPATSDVPATTWLAGLRVERDPDALDRDTRALTDVLGGSLVVSPASCLEGLPRDVDRSEYVLGAVAPTRAELDGLVASTGRDALFVTEVEVLCTD